MLGIEQLVDIDPADRRELLASLSWTARAWLNYEAAVLSDLTAWQWRGGATQFMGCDDDEILLSGPAGTGKSLAALHRVLNLCAHNPGTRALLVRKTAKSLTSSALVTWREKVAARSLHAGAIEFYGGSQAEPAQYRLWNTSRIMLGGLDNPTKIMSTEYDCVVGDTLVESPSEVQRAYARPYSGQLTTITTARGHQLTGTPNHPVLTDHGWVGLGSLRQGDHVLSRVDGKPLAPHPDPHIADEPTPIAEVARTLAQSGGGNGRTERLETVPMDFHGDGAYGYVDVVSAGGLFQNGGRSQFGDPVPDLNSGGAELEQSVLVGDRTGIQRPLGGRSPLLALAAAAKLAHPLPVDLGTTPGGGGALPSGCQFALPFDVGAHPFLTLGQRVGRGTPGDAPVGHLPLESGDAYVDGRCYLRQPPLPGEVAPDRVVDVVVADAGRGRHVYNLQTVDSWYYANGIVSHNCIYVQEAIELDPGDWEALTTRLRNGVLPRMQLLADTNPSTPTHWLKARCDRGDCRLIESRHVDNPALFDDNQQITPFGRVYMDRLDRLTGPRKARLRDGKWVSAEGQIYEQWDDAVHVVDRFPIPDSWSRYLSVDFGFTNPFVCQWWAQDPDGRLFCYRELYRTQRLVEDHARQIVALSVGEPEPVAVVCDHDAEDRATLERHLGRSTVAAHKAITTGIEAVQARLRPAGDGRPRLFYLRDSLVERDPQLDEHTYPCSLPEEITGYVWQPAKDGRAAKEEPVKLHDHACDTTRYLVAQVDLVGRPNLRWL